jgi:outer membrane protein OmpA-like peptidoglycan-associated protein
MAKTTSIYTPSAEVAKPQPTPATVQCALTIGAVNDPLEAEADAVADRVMRMPMPGTPVVGSTVPAIQRQCAACEQEELQRQPLAAVSSIPTIQRQCAACAEEEELQRKPIAETIRRKGDGGQTVSPAITSSIHATRGSGSRMDGATQSFMESRFGTDFSNVNIHTGDYAVQLSRDLSAKAFTVGNDIYFNSGQYNPGSDSGKHLLAHELTHTVQQGGGLDAKFVQRFGDAAAIPRTPTSCQVPESGTPTTTEYHLFPNNQHQLTPAQEASVASFAQGWVASRSFEPIRIDGYASSRGEHDHNWPLSCRRAEAVKAVLVRYGVGASYITTYMNGETEEFGSEAANRRVNISMNTPAPAPIPIPPRTVPTPAPMPALLRFWMNAFIPVRFIPGAFRASAGPYAGREVFAGPPHPGSYLPPTIHTNGCFETDDRTFSPAFPAPSSRVTILMEFDTARRVLTARSSLYGGFTFEIDCTTGAVLCTSTVTPSGLGIHVVPVPGTTSAYTIVFDGSASDPCVVPAPSLAARGTIVIDLTTRTFTYAAFTTIFPAFEMYFNDGTATRALFTAMPLSTTPFSLLVPAARPHAGSGSF